MSAGTTYSQHHWRIIERNESNIMEIAPGLYAMSQRQGIFVHAFLIKEGDELLLIDTLHSTDAALILAMLHSIGKGPKDLTGILLTHAHRSHLGGLAKLRTLCKAPVYSHALESDIVAGKRRQSPMTLRPMPPYIVWPGQIVSRFVKHPPSYVDHCVDEGDRVGPLQVLHTPGHTPGHLAYYWPEQRALFAGDALVSFPRFDSGWPGYMLNLEEQRRTIQRLASLDVERVCVGHGEPVTTDAPQLLQDLAGRVQRKGLH